MKKMFLCLFILVGLECFSQIALDFHSTLMNLRPIKLTNEETKYYLFEQTNLNNNQTFQLFNLDGSLYKTIQMPPKPDPNAFTYMVQYISRTLFDNDLSNIEYLVDYQWDSLYGTIYLQHKVQVIREDGSILLDEMYGQCFFEGLGVFSTENGTKLHLSGYYYANGTPCQYVTKVFNLPGELPTNTEDRSTTATSSLLLYPNPNNGSFFIQFHSNGGNENVLQLYSSTGKLIDTYDSKSDMLHISNSGLNDGLYLLKSQSESKSMMTKMIIRK